MCYKPSLIPRFFYQADDMPALMFLFCYIIWMCVFSVVLFFVKNNVLLKFVPIQTRQRSEFG